MLKKLFLVSFMSIALLAIGAVGTYKARHADAHTDPSGCGAAEPVTTLQVYKADGSTPVSGAVAVGETIRYAVKISHSSSNQCNFQGGTIMVRLPDGTATNITPAGGIPLITANSPYTSSQTSYVVSASDGARGSISATVVYASRITHASSIDTVPSSGTGTPSSGTMICVPR